MKLKTKKQKITISPEILYDGLIFPRFFSLICEIFIIFAMLNIRWLSHYARAGG